MNHDEIKSELNRLQSEAPDGVLTAAAVLGAATDPQSVLHRMFSWDDQAAAHQHRLNQARHLLISYRIVLRGPVSRTVPVRVSLLADRTRPGGGYRLTEDVLADEELTQKLRDTAIAQLEAWLRKFAALPELTSPIAAVLDSVRLEAAPQLQEASAA